MWFVCDSQVLYHSLFLCVAGALASKDFSVMVSAVSYFIE